MLIKNLITIPEQKLKKRFNYEINLDSQISKGLPDIGNGHKNSRYVGTKLTALRYFVY